MLSVVPIKTLQAKSMFDCEQHYLINETLSWSSINLFQPGLEHWIQMA